MAARQEVTLVIRARDLTRSVFRRIGRGIQRFRVGLGGLIAGGAFAAIAKDALDAATAIEGASARLDVAGDDLEALKVIAQDLNIPFTSLVTVLQRLQTNASRAADGNSELLDAFRELGIATSPRELRGLGGLEILTRLADTASTRRWSEIAGSIARIGDTEAVGLRGLLEQGGAGLQRQIEELQATAVVDAQARREAAETEAQLRRELLEVQKNLTEALVSLRPLIEALTSVIGPAASLFGEAVRAGQESGAFGLGRAAFEASQDPATAAARLAALSPLALPPGLANVIVKHIADIAANTKNGGRLQ